MHDDMCVVDLGTLLPPHSIARKLQSTEKLPEKLLQRET